MRRWTIDRVGAACGIGFLVLNVVGNAIPGSPPGTGESPEKIASFFSDHRHAVLVSAVLTGIAAPLFLVLLGALALRLRAAGLGAAAVVTFGLGVAGITIGTVSDALYASLARIGSEGDHPLAQGVYQLQGFIAGKSLWFAAGVTLVVGWAGRRRLPRWYTLIGLVAGVLLVLGGVSVRSRGFFAPLGGMAGIAFLALLVWTLATCVLLGRGEERVTTASP